MKNTLFLTGASGFIGTHLLRHLNLEDYRHVYCLSRTETPVIKDLTRQDKFTFIKGDIFDTRRYKRYLGLAGTVVHLAAVTGKARPESYFKVNVKGLKILIECCEQVRVERFLNISSIAVKYSNADVYYYAQSKRKAEALLSDSRLRYTTVRPTIVLGVDSPIWNSFLDLVKLPFCVVLGNGNAKLQPIYIDDLIDSLLMILSNDVFFNETYDLGGPEIISVRHFLEKICKVFYQKAFRPVKIPLKQIKFILRLLEKQLSYFLPVTAGQLTLFENDSTVEDNVVMNRLSRPMKNIDETLDRLMNDEIELVVKNRQQNECRVFCRYLVNEIPSDYIIKKYNDGIMITHHKSSSGHTYLEAVIAKTATKNTIFCRLADVYTAIFSRNSVFRRKLVLLLAILECSPPVNLKFDLPDANGKIIFCFSGLLKGAAFICCILISTIIFLPFHLIDIILSKFHNN